MPVQQEQEARWTIVPVLETVGRAIRRGFQCLRSIFVSLFGIFFENKYEIWKKMEILQVDDRVRRRNRSPELERGELWSGRRLVAQSIRTYGVSLRVGIRTKRVMMEFMWIRTRECSCPECILVTVPYFCRKRAALDLVLPIQKTETRQNRTQHLEAQVWTIGIVESVVVVVLITRSKRFGPADELEINQTDVDFFKLNSLNFNLNFSDFELR